MRKEASNQEILLLANSTFFQKQLCEKVNSEDRYLSHIARLEKACWNGLLDELLPEIMEKSTAGKNLFVTQIQYSKSFLQVELSESVIFIQERFSINPDLFLSELLLTN
jgi:hypothetical protein